MPYDSKRLQKIRDFLKIKAKEFKIKEEKVASLDANANYLRHVLETCFCAECKETSHLKVSNTIIQPTEFLLKIEPVILELKDPELETIIVWPIGIMPRIQK